MHKPKPIIASQEASEITKISDLIEVAGSRPDLARWYVSGVEYEYAKGALHVTVRHGLQVHRLHLDGRTKTAAKRAVFEALRS